MVLQIAKAILAIAEVSKMVKDVVVELNQLYVNKQIDDNRDFSASYEIKRAYIIRDIQNAKNDQERIAYSIILNDINNGNEMQ